MLRVTLIRHGQTEGNRHSRYIGITDEPLCSSGREALKSRKAEKSEILFVSPLRRCRETAQILFGEQDAQIVPDLAECNFGEFENKNYKELDGNPHYQQWVDSGGTLPFPGGESKEGFALRSVNAFQEKVEECFRNGIASASFVVHGGTIMCIMEAFADPRKPFYEWHVENGGGYSFEIVLEEWKQDIRKFRNIHSL